MPKGVADVLLDRGIQTFTCELTEAGILYRPLEVKTQDAPKLPSWLVKNP